MPEKPLPLPPGADPVEAGPLVEADGPDEGLPPFGPPDGDDPPPEGDWPPPDGEEPPAGDCPADTFWEPLPPAGACPWVPEPLCPGASKLTVSPTNTCCLGVTEAWGPSKLTLPPPEDPLFEGDFPLEGEPPPRLEFPLTTPGPLWLSSELGNFAAPGPRLEPPGPVVPEPPGPLEKLLPPVPVESVAPDRKLSFTNVSRPWRVCVLPLYSWDRNWNM